MNVTAIFFIVLIVGGLIAAYIWDKRNDRKHAASQALIDAQLHADGLKRVAQWDAFDAAIEQRKDDVDAAATSPVYIISVLLGQEYPRYGVYYRTVKVGKYQNRWSVAFMNSPVTTERLPMFSPGDLPEVTIDYECLTENTFETEQEAAMWLELFVSPELRQTGYDDDATHQGPFGDIDAQLTEVV